MCIRDRSNTGYFDYFAYGQGNFSLSLENHVPDMYFDQGAFIELHKKMRSVSGNVPVMALGRIGEPGLANKILEEGFGDLVGMSRALITDPAWPEKARLGNSQDIRPCVYDNFSWVILSLSFLVCLFCFFVICIKLSI